MLRGPQHTFPCLHSTFRRAAGQNWPTTIKHDHPATYCYKNDCTGETQLRKWVWSGFDKTPNTHSFETWNKTSTRSIASLFYGLWAKYLFCVFHIVHVKKLNARPQYATKARGHTHSHTLYTKPFHFFINFVNVELVYRVNCQLMSLDSFGLKGFYICLFFLNSCLTLHNNDKKEQTKKLKYPRDPYFLSPGRKLYPELNSLLVATAAWC